MYNPRHLVISLQLLGNTLRYRHLPCKPFKHFLSLSINIRKIDVPLVSKLV